MNTTVSRRYHFESAHYLPYVADGHKCKRTHGHNYEIIVEITGSLIMNGGENTGFIIDFWDLDYIVMPLINRVDHQLLNNIVGLENPTAENIARWFHANIANRLNQEHAYGKTNGEISVKAVTVYETKDCWAQYHL